MAVGTGAAGVSLVLIALRGLFGEKLGVVEVASCSCGRGGGGTTRGFAGGVVALGGLLG